MTNAELIAKIKAEIERRKSLLTQHSKLTYDLILETFIKEYDDLLSFLSTLESEKPMNQDEELNEEIKRFVAEYDYERSEDILLIAIVARHFTGWQKEQMMKEAVAVEVVGDKRDLRLIDSTQRCLFNAKRGDWLKIVIVKEDEK